MQPIRTIWTILVGDHPGIIPVKFGQNPMSSVRGEGVLVKKFTHDGQRPVTIAHPEHFVLRWAKNNENNQGNTKDLILAAKEKNSCIIHHAVYGDWLISETYTIALVP